MGLNTIGIIGAGQMGAGIAQVAAQSGLNILLNDISDEMVARGRQGIERSLERMMQRGRVKLDEGDRIMRRIEVTTSLDDLAATDFVITSNAIGEQFARCAAEAANPYNALQPFTTNAPCNP